MVEVLIWKSHLFHQLRYYNPSNNIYILYIIKILDHLKILIVILILLILLLIAYN